MSTSSDAPTNRFIRLSIELYGCSENA